MENKKLTWEEIKAQYDQEWIILDDFEWNDADEFPSSGIVSLHSKSRVEFDGLIAARESGFDSALIFVGDPVALDSPSTTRGYSRVEYGTR